MSQPCFSFIEILSKHLSLLCSHLQQPQPQPQQRRSLGQGSIHYFSYFLFEKRCKVKKKYLKTAKKVF